MSATFQELPIDGIRVSMTQAQVARRKRFDEAKLNELASSIKAIGVKQPIVVRRIDASGEITGGFELVAGERRFLAAKQAGLDLIPAMVDELTDEQVLEVQLIENLQREDLHPMHEAESYGQLVQTYGHKVEEIYAKVGKSRSYVYGRMELLKLCDVARAAFYNEDLSASTALLVARIPGDEQQKRAIAKLTEKDWAGRTMSYRDAARYIHDTFMLELSKAPFPTDDATLVPSAGSCGPCPMRTGNAPDLFGDVKGANVCTNPGCFQAKKAAHVKREATWAAAAGEPVIRGGEARKILPPKNYMGYSSDGSHKQLRSGYARPKDKCLDDPKGRTYAQLAGADAPKVQLQNPDTGKVEKVFRVADIADRLKEKGVKPKPPAANPVEARKQNEERTEQRREAELARRGAIFRAVIKAAPTKLGRDDLIALIDRAGSEFGWDDRGFVAFGWEPPKKRDDNAFTAHLQECTAGELAQLAVAVLVMDEATSDWGKPNELLALAKRLGVDVKKVQRELAPKEPTAEPAKAPAKKKAKARAKAA